MCALICVCDPLHIVIQGHAGHRLRFSTVTSKSASGVSILSADGEEKGLQGPSLGEEGRHAARRDRSQQQGQARGELRGAVLLGVPGWLLSWLHLLSGFEES